MGNRRSKRNKVIKQDNYFIENGIKYRTPKQEEFVVGFEFESCFWYFTKTNDDDWTEAVITEDNYDVFHSLYEEDAYSTEFRVKV